MRNLKKQLEKIYRKAALKLVQMGIEVAPAQQPAPTAAAEPAAAVVAATAEGSPDAGAADTETQGTSSRGNGSEAQPAASDAASSNDAFCLRRALIENSIKDHRDKIAYGNLPFELV